MDGPPLSIYTHVLQTMVQGKTIYQRDEKLAQSTGGN
jgi:hypothetical protein